MKSHVFSKGAVLLLAFAFYLALPAVPSAGGTNGSTTSSSECLGLPTDAVEDWKFLYPCCFDEETCEDACTSWARTCNDIARVAFECQYHSARELTDLFKGAECDTDPDKDDSKACSKEAASGLKELRDFLDQDQREAKELCFDCYDDCLNFCEDD